MKPRQRVFYWASSFKRAPSNKSHMDYQSLLEEILSLVQPMIGQGRVANYIPALASVDPNQFGMALATVEGEVFGVGHCKTPFSIQSISKVFTLALALAREGDS